ncbi:MAG: phosphoribosylformylglycinamidine synthase [Oscillospiraceae bacterium]|nr:phosphoribosylformylglycinamidine synthase [Oscillospiraceae bacterium]
MVRFLVEKLEPFRFDERDMLNEIRDILGISGITNVRIFNGYDTEGIKEINKAKGAVFSEAGQDIVFEGSADIKEAAFVYAVTAALGQYDQREDFATQLLQIMEPNGKPVVRVFKQFALYGEISEAEYKKIKEYFINPLEMREIPLSATTPRIYTQPDDVAVISGFKEADEKGLKTLASGYGIAMEADNLLMCRDYFAKEGRDPTVTEMKVLDTYWSDHCRHSTFLTVLEDVKINENKYTAGLKHAERLYEQAKKYVYGETERPLCLMDIATMEMKKQKKSGALSDMEITDEVNACSIETTALIDGKPNPMIVMFKNETHNHPTEMEPFGGASTCLGGGIRDPLSGRAFVHGAIRVTGSGDPRELIEETIPGKLPQRKITQTAANGYSSYGNQIGLASGHLIEYYDPGFKAKRLECGALVAAAPKENITRAAPKSGDVIVLVGGKTGRDGCGGATGSSKEQDDDALIKGGAEVQKGNPIIERNIVRLFRKPHVSKIIKKCNDFGAGGICVAVGELADGLKIDLDKVPVKYPGLDGTELAISESQERMAVVLNASDLDMFLNEAAAENLIAVKIADVTDTGRLIMSWQGDEIVNLNSDFLNSGGVRQRASVVVTAPSPGGLAPPSLRGACDDWLENLSDLNVCSKKGIANRFDFTAANTTVFAPFGGAGQITPELGLAMRLPLIEGETKFGTLMSVGYNPSLGYESPFHAALYAVVESVMKLAAMGGDYRKIRLSFQEYFERLSSKESWGKPYAALMGAFLAQNELGVPSIGGKDSMSGTFKDINVPPSLISFAVTTVDDTSKLISRAFKNVGSKVYLLTATVDESGVPDFDALKKNMEKVFSLAQGGNIKAASTIGIGGISAAISEMAFGNGIGFEFAANCKVDLFSPLYTSLILETDADYTADDDFVLLGHTTKQATIEIDGISISLDEARDAWEGTLEGVFPTAPATPAVCDNLSPANPSPTPAPLAALCVQSTPPRVLIPVFPGTNGEYELERQFRKAGADVSVFLFKTLSPEVIANSYKELTEAVSNADILAIPSGMSAGAEPDGSAKLIALILRQTAVKDAVNKLVERKGLVLGLGEGFKALLKTGLIQTGQITDSEQTDITLTKYPLNQYHCTLKDVIIGDTNSPWLKDMSGTNEMLPVSGQDTALHLSDALYNEYLSNGQIAGHFTCGEPQNSVEAIVSENGLILGKTGLSERIETGLYTNVVTATESRIFKNAVNYIVTS